MADAVESMKSMMKDAVETMGRVLPDNAYGRDAVHVAVFSAIADEKVFPGQGVCLIQQGEPDCLVSTTCKPGEKTVGIVDPFIDRPLTLGERFWVYLYPRTITSLAHKWSHPSFDTADTAETAETAEEPYVGLQERHQRLGKKTKSVEWLRDFTARADCPGYEAVMEAATKIADGEGDVWDDEYLHFDDMDAHGEIPPEFWNHVEIVLGRPIKGGRPTHFSCSC